MGLKKDGFEEEWVCLKKDGFEEEWVCLKRNGFEEGWLQKDDKGKRSVIGKCGLEN